MYQLYIKNVGHNDIRCIHVIGGDGSAWIDIPMACPAAAAAKAAAVISSSSAQRRKRCRMATWPRKAAVRSAAPGRATPATVGSCTQKLVFLSNENEVHPAKQVPRNPLVRPHPNNMIY